MKWTRIGYFFFFFWREVFAFIFACIFFFVLVVTIWPNDSLFFFWSKQLLFFFAFNLMHEHYRLSFSCCGECRCIYICRKTKKLFLSTAKELWSRWIMKLWDIFGRISRHMHVWAIFVSVQSAFDIYIKKKQIDTHFKIHMYAQIPVMTTHQYY